MRKLLLATIVLAFVVSLIGCRHTQEIDYNLILVQQLATPRPLQKLFEVSDEIKGSSSNWSAAGGFFLFFGGAGASGSSQTWDYTQYSVLLAFERPDMLNTYAIVKIPLSKINVKLIENGDATVAFYMSSGISPYRDLEGMYEKYGSGYRSCIGLYSLDIQESLNVYLRFAVITTTKEDWPKYIEPPLNNPDFYQQSN